MTVKVTKPAINVREELADLRKPTGIAGEAMLRAETPQEQFQLIGAGRRNLIINGDMRIAQRGTSKTMSAGSNLYCLDRFTIGNDTGSAVLTTTQQSNGPVTNDGTFKYYTQVNVDTADTNGGNNEFAAINYYVEANDWEPLGYGSTGAKKATLSFYHAHSIAGTYCISIRNSGGGSNRNYLVEYHQDQANVWQKTTVTLEGDTTGTWTSGTTSGISIMFTMTNGSTYQGSTTNQWFGGTYYHSTPSQTSLTATTNAKFRITGVQLELGKVATPFEHRSYGEELAACQRYFHTGTFGMWCGTCLVSVANRIAGTGGFPVTMRATPTIAFGSSDIDGTGAFGSPTAASVTADHMDRVDVTNGVTGRIARCLYTASAEL